MITNITEIKEKADILTFISRSVSLKQKGKHYTGLCPFHQESTPSFTVYPADNHCHCFGCGFSGDIFRFQMQISGSSFVQAVESVAQSVGLSINRNEVDSLDEEGYFSKEAIFITNARALQNWQNQFVPHKEGNRIVLGDRWFDERIANHFGVCITPAQDVLSANLSGTNPDVAAFINAGLINEKYGKMRDFFVNRIIFPIRNEHGKIAGFSGRIFNTEQAKTTKAKYLNTAENAVFKKSGLLFGLWENKLAIRNADEVILVEGFTDVMRLLECGISNVIAVCGSTVTAQHAALLKRYASKVILLMDGDNAGLNAAKKAIPILENAGLFVRVCSLADNLDPENAIRVHGVESFVSYLKENTLDAIIWSVQQKKLKCGDGQCLQMIVEESKDYLSSTPFTALISGWATQIAALLEVDKESLYPNKTCSKTNKGKRYYCKTLFAQGNKFFYVKSDDVVKISNFIIEPDFRIITSNTLWRVQLIGQNNERALINLDTKMLNSVESFRQKIEQKGNFVFHGNIHHMNLIKEYVIFNAPKSCIELNSLGWNEKYNFWVWYNGISKSGVFIASDETGVVKINEEIFLIKAAFYGRESGEKYIDEKNFRYESGDITLNRWIELIVSSYSSNGYLIVLYYLASIFRNIIYNELNFFPHLFGFGEMGSGKSTMAMSLLRMFGKPQKQLMLSSSTEVGMSRKAGKFVNGIAWFDEYKNNIPAKRVQFLKGLYDEAGYVRGEYSNDLQTNEVRVKCGVIITGQDLPTADPALFDRCILLLANKAAFTEETQKAFEVLRNAEQSVGFSHITDVITPLHVYIEPHFRSEFNRISKAIRHSLNETHPDTSFEERQINNYASLWTICSLLKEKLSITDDFFSKAEKVLLSALAAQQPLILNNDDKAQFWEQVNFLLEDSKLTNDHLFIKNSTKVSLQKSGAMQEQKHFSPAKNLLFIRFSRVWDKISQNSRFLSSTDTISRGSMESYLKNSKAYLGNCSSVRFLNGKVQSCMVFDYDELGVRIDQ